MPRRKAKPLSVNRAPYDGKPFYCAACGMGYAEYLACEEPECQLEPEKAARDRAVRVTVREE